jgi:hypothetical protein
VTRGTGDVKPQIMTISTGVAGGLDDYVTSQAQLPVPRFGAQRNLATLFELLWVDWYIANQNLADTLVTEWAFLSTSVSRQDADTSTLATLQEDIDDPRTIAMAIKNVVFTTSGASEVSMPKRIDLTDSNGNGFLIATDRIVITQGSVGNVAAAGSTAKIGYRLVNVGVQEYVGIVQSQQ